MNLSIKLTEGVSTVQPYGSLHKAEPRIETIVEVDEVTFTRSLTASFLRALADEIDPSKARASLGQWTVQS